VTWRANVRDMDGELIDTINCHRRFEIGEDLTVVCPLPYQPMPMTVDAEVAAVVYLVQVEARCRRLNRTGEVCITLNAPEAAIYRKALAASKPPADLTSPDE